MDARKCVIGGSLTVLGLLMVFVCVSAAQNAGRFNADAAESERNKGSKRAVYHAAAFVRRIPRHPYGPLPPQSYGPHSASGPVGKFQALSHDGQLLLLDTTSGACWVRTDADGWNRFAPPVDEARDSRVSGTVNPIPQRNPAAKAMNACSATPPEAWFIDWPELDPINN